MPARITIWLGDDLLRALRTSRSVTLHVRTGSADGRPVEREPPRAGSWSAKVMAWAGERGRSFRTADVAEEFGLSRGHASMLLLRMIRAGHLCRTRRGVYDRA